MGDNGRQIQEGDWVRRDFLLADGEGFMGYRLQYVQVAYDSDGGWAELQ